MSMPIHFTGLPPAIPEIKPVVGDAKTSGAGGEFRNALADAVSRVEQYNARAEKSVDQLLSGQREDIHNVALDTQRADLAFELFLQTRNKVVEAYQEIMRMQV